MELTLEQYERMVEEAAFWVVEKPMPFAEGVAQCRLQIVNKINAFFSTEDV